LKHTKGTSDCFLLYSIAKSVQLRNKSLDAKSATIYGEIINNIPPGVETNIPWREKLPLQAAHTSPSQVYSKMVDAALLFSRFSPGIQSATENYHVLDHNIEHVAQRP
jgi:hypothetical protein